MFAAKLSEGFNTIVFDSKTDVLQKFNCIAFNIMFALFQKLMANSSPTIVIVGAGPAGATASLYLCKMGIKHIIIDKHEFPRHKTCGDGLTGSVKTVIAHLNREWLYEISSLEQQFAKCYGIRIVSANYHSVDLPLVSDPSKYNFAPAFIAKRFDFDNFLVSKINPEFATTKFGYEVTDVTRTGSKVNISFSNGQTNETVEADIVIGADSERSIVLKSLCPRKKSLPDYCGSVRAYYSGVTGCHEGNYLEMHFMKNVPGYFWIFPLPNGLVNVGVGMLSSDLSKRKTNLRHLLVDFTKESPVLKDRFAHAQIEGKIEGWSLPLGSIRYKTYGDNFMLCGDAASLIDPATGEGVSNAMVSGQIAAETIQQAIALGKWDDASLAAYHKRLYKKVGPELRRNGFYQKVYATFPWALELVFKNMSKSEGLRQQIIKIQEYKQHRWQVLNPFFYIRLLTGWW